MIKTIENPVNLKLNVYLRDGTEFLNKDTTDRPLGDSERVIAFWEGDIIKIYPLDLVERAEFFEDKH